MEFRIIDGKEYLVIDKYAESRKKANKLYFEKNKEKVMENQKRWKKEKRMNDEEYRLKINERARQYYHNKKEKEKSKLFLKEENKND